MRMMVAAKRPSTLSLAWSIQDHTLVGRPDAPTQQDIQLSGLGIQTEHAVVDMDNNEVYVTPLDGARTCINGSVVLEKRRVRHGDRILWGNNHFFRLNCPRLANSPSNVEPEQKIDYDFAQQELMENELVNDPIQEAIGAIEKQHEEDKQEALDKQRQMYERQMQMLRNQLMSPGTPSFPLQLFDASRLTPSGSQNSIQRKYQQWAQEREMMFKQSLVKLREEVVKANALVREANTLAQEMGKLTEFHVTLQIPASNLSPNRRRGAFVSEPAILVKRKNRSSQIWSLEKLENKIIDMREMYEDRKASGGSMMDMGPPIVGDPFYESQENHNLIGVANIFLECLFHDVNLDYHVPIISQQGEVAGKLHIEISKVGGAVLDHYVDMAANDDDCTVPMGAPLLIRVCIKEARGLPLALSNFVFCQYSFWGESEPCVVPPEINPDTLSWKDDHTVTFVFNHEKHFRVPITEEFIEYCSEGALSIEVWGHRSQSFGKDLLLRDAAQAKSRSVADRWNEVMRKIEVWAEIHELNDQGDYTPVEVTPKPDVSCAGVMQLRQGHSRRVLLRVRTVTNSGTLPLICESISSLAIGCVCVRSHLRKGLDSYQEEDLTVLRDHWSKALARRKKYLDEQIQKLINKPDKSEADSERERALIEQWVCLMEERNAVLVPSPGSQIPGAPADWSPPPNLEEHMPVIFLDLNADDMSAPNSKEGFQAVGINSILPKEHSTDYVDLPIIKSYIDKDSVCAFASWDSSLHDSVHLNRATPTNERVYMILKAIIRLSHPAAIELVLRKRICINIYKKQSLSSFTSKLKNKIVGTDQLHASGVTYEVVSNLPKGSEDLEDMETLAQMAASQNEVSTVDGETYIEKYIKGVSTVESILTLDRLRQEVAVKEMLASSGRLGSNLRKTTSVPNINQFRADNLHDLTQSLTERSYHNSTTRSPSFHGDLFRLKSGPEAEDSARVAAQHKRHSFGLATTKSLLSPLSSVGKAIVKPMRTLLEEQQGRSSRLPVTCVNVAGEHPSYIASPGDKEGADYHSLDMDEFQYSDQSDQSQQMSRFGRHITPSSTADSLSDIHMKGNVPSVASSGYGSRAVSSLTLTSEDSLSIRSNEETAEGGHHYHQQQSHKLTSSESGEICQTQSDVEPVGAQSSEPCEQVLDVNRSQDESSDIQSTTYLPSPDPAQDLDDIERKSFNDLPTCSEVNESDKGESRQQLQVVENLVVDEDSDLYSVNATEELEKLGMEDEEEEDDVEATNNLKVFEPEEVIQPKVIDQSISEATVIEVSETSVIEPKVIDPSVSETNVIEPKAQCPDIKKPVTDQGSRSSDDNDITSSINQSVAATKDKNSKGKYNVMKALSAISSSSSSQNKGEKSVNKGNKSQGDKMVVSNSKRKGSGIRSRPMTVGISPKTETITRAWLDEGECITDKNKLDNYLHGNEDAMSECSFGSRADLDWPHDDPVPVWICEGESVAVMCSKGMPKAGIVRFVGTVQFAGGVWVGVELDKAEGKNDGSVKGVQYFQCRSRHGVFVRHDKLMSDKRGKSSKKEGGNTRRSLPSIGGSLAILASAGGSSGASYMRSTRASSMKKK